MKLSLIIPVCNDLDGVQNVVSQACELGIFEQILIADDASDVPLSDELVCDGLSETARSGMPNIVILRADTRQGAGAARNRALAQLCTSHVLFFDADDHLRPELAELWHRLQTESEEFDFCMFNHVEERRRQEGHLGMFAKDETLWCQAGAMHPFCVLDAGQGTAALTRLAQVAAYPWNKIYRSAFLQDHAVRCSETTVHNDIALHWMGFFAAKRVISSSALGCEHVVGQTRNHITLRNGVERLQLFQALADVRQALAGQQQGDGFAWRVAFACFYLDVIGWARGRIDPALQSEFDRLAHQFLSSDLDPAVFMAVNHRNPELARRGLNLMTQGG